MLLLWLLACLAWLLILIALALRVLVLSTGPDIAPSFENDAGDDAAGDFTLPWGLVLPTFAGTFAGHSGPRTVHLDDGYDDHSVTVTQLNSSGAAPAALLQNLLTASGA